MVARTIFLNSLISDFWQGIDPHPDRLILRTIQHIECEMDAITEKKKPILSPLFDNNCH